MERLVVTTEVYRPPPVVYEFLEDFPGYANYSEYLREVRSSGSGEGRRYALTFAWWKLSYTAHSEVTALDPPRQIDWRIVSDLDAAGRWEIDPLWDHAADVPAGGDGEPPATRDRDGGGDATHESGGDGSGADPADAPASRVAFVAEFDPESVHSGMVDLPSLVSLDWVIEKVTPKIESEATRVVERAVADIEGRQRSVDLDVELIRE